MPSGRKPAFGQQNPKTDKALDGHAEDWANQRWPSKPAGAMGVDYWDNAALIIFEAATLEEVETMARNDLAMKAHAFQAQVRPFDVFWASNKFTPVCGRKDAPAEVTIEEVAA